MSESIAEHNSKIIVSLNYCLEIAIDNTSKGTQLEYGSEFKSSQHIDSLFEVHSLWPMAKSLLDHGCTISLPDIDPKVEKEDLICGPQYGNHKGAINKKEVIHSFLNKNAVNGLALPIATDTVVKMNGGNWFPLIYKTK